MTFRAPFPPAAKEYIRLNMDKESRTVLAYKITCLFGYPCTKEGVKGVIRQLKKEDGLIPTGGSSAGCIAGY